MGTSAVYAVAVGALGGVWGDVAPAWVYAVLVGVLEGEDEERDGVAAGACGCSREVESSCEGVWEVGIGDLYAHGLSSYCEEDDTG